MTRAQYEGPITWRISARAETLALLLKQSSQNQIVDYMKRDSARGAIQPGLKILALFAQNRARIISPGKRARKSVKISCNRNGISARAEKQKTIWLRLGSRRDFSGIKAIK